MSSSMKTITTAALIAMWILGGCSTPAPEVLSSSGGVEASGTGMVDTDTGAADEFAGLTSMGQWNRAVAALDDCCQQPGQAEECWGLDASLEEGDFVTCSVDADCKEGHCDINYNGPGYTGLCRCNNGNTSCQNALGEGGVCHTYGNGDRRCGPSWCNGYYICSCWGGCVWWKQGTTPREEADLLGLHCCEWNYPGGGPRGFFSASAGCGPGVDTDSSLEDACTDHSDCDDGNPCTVNQCLPMVSGYNICSTIITTLAPCEADGLWCTIDRCDTDAACANTAPMCPPDSYMDGAVSAPNTCTLDCDETTNTCYVPLSVPSDIAVKPSDGACDYWSCVPAGSTVIPERTIVDCSSLDDECNAYACDIAGAKDNCADVSAFIGVACTQSDTANLCIDAECDDINFDGVATCEDFDLTAPIPDLDPCNVLACAPVTGAWNYVADPSALGAFCSDGDPCTQNDVCVADGDQNLCTGVPMVCTVGECETDRQCDSSTGLCLDVTYAAPNVICDDGDGLHCTVGRCDGAGTCQPIGVVCTGSAFHECDTRLCVEEVAGCADIYNPLSGGMSCTDATVPPNCPAVCGATAHSVPALNSAGYLEGVCGMGTAINDSCNSAIAMGTFTPVSGDQFTIEGSTRCATNRHRAGDSSTECWEGGMPPTFLGALSPDVVYSFTFETTGGGESRQRFVVKLEPEALFDGAVYLATTCNMTGTPSQIAAQACSRYSIGADQFRIQEDRCAAPYDCTKVGPAAYDGEMASAIFREPATAAPQNITVYVYVDGTRDQPGFADMGDFFLSVTRERGCPDPSTWYSGRIRNRDPGDGTRFVRAIIRDFSMDERKPEWHPDFQNHRPTQTAAGLTYALHCPYPEHYDIYVGAPGFPDVPDATWNGTDPTDCVLLSNNPASESIQRGIVRENLGADGKPAFNFPGDPPQVTSEASFNQWYNTIAGVNYEFAVDLRLEAQSDIVLYDYANIHWCESTTMACDEAPWGHAYCYAPPAGYRCYSPCTPWGNDATCVGPDPISLGAGLGFSSDCFFPIDYVTCPGTVDLTTCDGIGSCTAAATVGFGHESLFPGHWFPGYPGRVQTDRNYGFTTEVNTVFTYEAGQRFAFQGDDDLWVFIDGKLALDMGGLHPDMLGIIDLDNIVLANGSVHTLVPGQMYTLDIFHAERFHEGSNFRITTNISDLTSRLEPIPINGVDFPGFYPDLQSNNAGTHLATGIVLSGSTFGAGNHYTGETGDGPLDFSGNDELWELGPIADGTSVNVSLCDFGGFVNTATVNPQIALLNCFGERMAWNDDGASCAGSPSGFRASSMEPSPALNSADGPYFLLIDSTTAGGMQNAYNYQVSLYYEPYMDNIVVNCDAYDGASSIAATLPKSGSDLGSLVYYPGGGCVGGTFRDGCHLQDLFQQATNRNINIRSNAGLMQQCDNGGTNTYTVLPSSYSSCWMTNNWGEQNCPASPVDARTVCFPIHFHLTAIVEHRDGGGNVIDTKYINYELEQNRRDGNDADLFFPLQDLVNAQFDGSIPRTELYITALNFTIEHRRGLTAEQYELCKAKCSTTTNFYVDMQPSGSCPTW